MASPFRIFRKHSKGMMAALVLLCIGLFVFSRGSGGSNRNTPSVDAKATVATWKGGSINRRELSNLVAQRRILDEFLRQLFRAGGGTSDTPFPYNVPNFLVNPRADLTDVVVTSEMLADQARQAGMTVNIDLIKRCFDEYGLRNVSGAEKRTILEHLSKAGAATNEAVVIDCMRKLLMGHFYVQWYEVQPSRPVPNSAFVVLPEERWRDWRRVNQRISLRAAVLNVDNFLGDVGEPTDAQLQAFYNDYKEFVPDRKYSVVGRDLPGPDPGFREPRRVRLQYVAAMVADRAAKLADKVTEEDIKYYYDRNKETEFVKEDLLGDEAEAGAKPEEQPATESANEVPAVQSPTDAAEPAAEKPGEKPADPAAEKPSEQGKSSSTRGRRSPFRLVALQAEAKSDSKGPQSAASTASESESKAAAEEKSPPAVDGASSSAKESAAKEAAPPQADAAPSVEYEPLDKVRDVIRQKLAVEKARDELGPQMAEISAELQTEYNRYASRVAEAKELKQELPPPSDKLANLAWLAEKYGMTYETKMSLLTDAQLNDTPVGSALESQSGRKVVGAAFLSAALYEPIVGVTPDGDAYLAMKVEDRADRVPPLEEVREKVLAAWKRAEAAKLAQKKAEAFAAEAEKSDQSFEEFFAARDAKVVKQTEMFSWLYDPGSAGEGNSLLLSSLADLSNVGPDFMDAAFKLEGKKTVGLLNFDHSQAFVIQLHSRQYTPEQLQAYFLEEVNYWRGQNDMLADHMRMFMQAAIVEVRDDVAGFKWDEKWIEQRKKDLAEHE